MLSDSLIGKKLCTMVDTSSLKSPPSPPLQHSKQADLVQVTPNRPSCQGTVRLGTGCVGGKKTSEPLQPEARVIEGR